MTHKNLLIFFVFLIALPTVAQRRGYLKALNPHIELGSIDLSKKYTTVQFSVTNIGSEPVTIQQVQPSCPCTVSEWPRNAVQPGDTSLIVYNIHNWLMPGPVVEYVTLYTDNAPQTLLLKATGFVPESAIGLPARFPYQMGDLRLNSFKFDFGAVIHGRSNNATIQFYNPTDKPIPFPKPKVLLTEIEVVDYPESINPGDSARITLRYSAQKKNYGAINRSFSLFPTEKSILEGLSPGHFIYSVHLKEFFNLSDTVNTPALTLSDSTISLDLTTTEIIEKSITLSNTGTKPLTIRKISTSCNCTISRPEKAYLAPGESADLVVKISPIANLKSVATTVLIITNDPVRPERRITILPN